VRGAIPEGVAPITVIHGNRPVIPLHGILAKGQMPPTNAMQRNFIRTIMKILKTKWYVTEKLDDKKHKIIGKFDSYNSAADFRGFGRIGYMRVRKGKEMIDLREKYGHEFIF